MSRGDPHIKVTGMLVRKYKLTPEGEQCRCGSSFNWPDTDRTEISLGGHFLYISLYTALSDSDFPYQTPLVRPKSAVYASKRDDEHPRHFNMGVPPAPRDNVPQPYEISARLENHLKKITLNINKFSIFLP